LVIVAFPGLRCSRQRRAAREIAAKVVYDCRAGAGRVDYPSGAK
jgi:hypothetical protein